MSYTINLGTSSKVKNSTERPTMTIPIDNVLLKDGCSVVNPIFKVKYAETPNRMSIYNYLTAFGCYYYIDDIISLNNNIYEIHCTRDPMATFKNDIKGYSGYILRTSDTNKNNPQLYDNIIAPSTEIKAQDTIASTGLNFSLGDTTVVIGTSGCGPIRSSATVDNYYYSTSKGVTSLLGDIFYNADIFGIIQQLKKITDCLTMIKVFPFKKADTTNSTADVYVGEYSQSVSGLEPFSPNNFSSASANGRYFGTSGSISLSGALYQYNDYRNYDSNFVNLVLRVPFVGSIALQPWVLRYSTITLTYKIDMISGVGECMIQAVSSSSVMTIGIYNCQVGFSVPSSSYITDYAEIVGNMVNMNAVGAILDNVVPPSSFSTLSPSSGASTINITNATLDYTIYDSENFTYGNERGKKCMKVETINNFADHSYIECLHPHVHLQGATPEEIDKVNGYLEGGFYYE